MKRFLACKTKCKEKKFISIIRKKTRFCWAISAVFGWNCYAKFETWLWNNFSLQNYILKIVNFFGTSLVLQMDGYKNVAMNFLQFFRKLVKNSIKVKTIWNTKNLTLQTSMSALCLHVVHIQPATIQTEHIIALVRVVMCHQVTQRKIVKVDLNWIYA